jgi:hypothetical protein
MLNRQNTAFVSQKNTGEDGSYAFTFGLAEFDGSGSYLFRIRDKNGADVLEIVKEYATDADKDDVYAVLMAQNQADILNLLSSGEKAERVLRIDGVYISDYKNLSGAGKSYVVGEFIKSSIESVQDCVSELKWLIAFEALGESTAANLDGKITVFADVLDFLNTDFKDGYNILGEYKTNANTLILNKKPFHASGNVSPESKFNDAFSEAVSITAVNISTSGNIKSNITQYNGGLKLNLTGDFSKLSDNNKNLVYNALLGKGFTSVSAIQAAFNAKVQSLLSGGGINTVSSGGGGNITSTVKADDNTYPADTPTPDGSQADGKTFSDLGGYDWAVPSIEYLANAGIIDGFGNNEFRPYENLTREQYVKILTVAFNAEISQNTEFNFVDVPPAAWYAPYVGTAYNLGIINGIGDNAFGAGVYVSRQDAAVIALRCLNIFGKNLDEVNGGFTFTDRDAIAPYAVDSVIYLQKSGIFNGGGDGYFKPAAPISRAEAAKVVYLLIKN